MALVLNNPGKLMCHSTKKPTKTSSPDKGTILDTDHSTMQPVILGYMVLVALYEWPKK